METNLVGKIVKSANQHTGYANEKIIIEFTDGSYINILACTKHDKGVGFGFPGMLVASGTESEQSEWQKIV